MKKASGFLSCALMLLFSGVVGAQPVAEAPTLNAPYRAVKTWYEQQTALNPTKAQQLEILREAVRSGPHSGDRRLERMFKNFRGAGYIDPTIPGVSKNLLLTAVDNRNVVQGASRTHVYATRIYHSTDFELLALV